MTRTSHRFVAPSGLSLAVHEWGGTGDPVLLAHPTGFHGVVWQPVAERLVARGRRVWSFDFRGHGDSDAADDRRFAWSEFADDADAVLDHLSLRGDPHLLAAGHSKGAASLLTVAVRDPESLARVWCYEPIVFPFDDPFPTGADNPMSAAARRRRGVWPSREEAKTSYASKPPLDALCDDALDAYVDYGVRDLPDGTVELKCRPHDEASMYEMGAANGLFGVLGEVTCPVRVVCGATSRSIPPSLGETLVERLAHATLEVWDGNGHFGPLEDPDHAVESMLGFADA